jgi:hypothetical protein
MIHRIHTPTPNVTATAALVMSEVFANYSMWLARDAEYRAQGYRSPACVHGVPTHYDADISCGACEDGLSPADFTFEDALEIAQYRVDEYIQLSKSDSVDDIPQFESVEDGIIFA